MADVISITDRIPQAKKAPYAELRELIDRATRLTKRKDLPRGVIETSDGIATIAGLE
jgi:hypothetical protein